MGNSCSSPACMKSMKNCCAKCFCCCPCECCSDLRDAARNDTSNASITNPKVLGIVMGSIDETDCKSFSCLNAEMKFKSQRSEKL